MKPASGRQPCGRQQQLCRLATCCHRTLRFPEISEITRREICTWEFGLWRGGPQVGPDLPRRVWCPTAIPQGQPGQVWSRRRGGSPLALGWGNRRRGYSDGEAAILVFLSLSSSSSCRASSSRWERQGEASPWVGAVATACRPAGGVEGGCGDSMASLGKPPAGVEAAGVSPQEKRSNSMPESGEVRAGVRKWRWRQRHSDTHWHLCGDRFNCCWKSCS